jgi:hypothetical protein
VFRQLGFALGIAVLTTTFFSALNSTLQHNLRATGMPAAQSEQFSRAVTKSAGAAVDALAAHPQTTFAAAARAAMTTPSPQLPGRRLPAHRARRDRTIPSAPLTETRHGMHPARTGTARSDPPAHAPPPHLTSAHRLKTKVAVIHPAE